MGTNGRKSPVPIELQSSEFSVMAKTHPTLAAVRFLLTSLLYSVVSGMSNARLIGLLVASAPALLRLLPSARGGIHQPMFQPRGKGGMEGAGEGLPVPFKCAIQMWCTSLPLTCPLGRPSSSCKRGGEVTF